MNNETNEPAVKTVKTIKLSDAGTELLITPEPDKYIVAIDPEIQKQGYLIVCAGSLAGTPSDNFQHPNYAVKTPSVHHFRTYYKSGHKRWRVKIGHDFYFIIPTNKIELPVKEGHSYIYGIINGVKVSFNVTGSYGCGCSTDYLTFVTSISCNHKLRDLKKLAEVSVHATDTHIPLEVIDKLAKPLSADSQRDYDRAYAEKQGLKNLLALNASLTFIPQVKLNGDLTYGSGEVADVVEVVYYKKLVYGEKKPDGWTPATYKDTARIKYFIVSINGSNFRTKLSHIDWAETLKLNAEKKLDIPVVV